MKPPRLLSLLAALTLSLVACGAKTESSASSGSAAAASEKSAAPNSKTALKAEAQPIGPVFKTKMMGNEMVQALVAVDLVAPSTGSR